MRRQGLRRSGRYLDASAGERDCQADFHLPRSLRRGTVRVKRATHEGVEYDGVLNRTPHPLRVAVQGRAVQRSTITIMAAIPTCSW
jgi:hypothetical protein